MLGVAASSESRAIVRLLYALEHQAANAFGRLLGINLFDLKTVLGVVLTKFPAQLIPALRDGTHPAPFAVADLEDLIHQLLRAAISLALHDAWILVLHFGPSFLELANSHQSAFKQINRLETRNDYGHFKARRNRFI